MLDTNNYPETECDIALDRTGCTTNLQIFPQGSSGARVQMQGTHYAQATQIAHPQLRNIFAGPERDYANYMFNVVVEHNCTVIRVVKRYAKPGAGEQRALETLVFVERQQEPGSRQERKPIVDLIRIPTFVQNHQTFAVELELTQIGSRLGAKKYLKKGTVLAQTKSVIDDEYCVGLHANTLLVSHPMVIEDSCLISQSLADRMMSYGYKTYRMTIGEKDFPLLLYKDRKGNPSLFPEVGEKVREDGILFAKREYDPLLAAIEMSETALTEPCGHFDDCTFVNPDAEVIDVKVHRDDIRPRRRDPETGENLPCEKMSTPVGMQEICDTYADAYSNFQGHIRSLYKYVKDDYRRKGYRDISYTPDAKQAIMYSIADNPREVNNNLSRYTKQFGQIKNDDYMIEITVKFPIPLSVSGKITDTMGGKGIVGEIVPDHLMPVDEFGNRVDLMMSENAMLRRTNFNRGFENYVNAARRDAQIRIVEMYEDGKTEEAFDYLLRFTGAVNPEWSYAIEEAHSDKVSRIDLLDAMATGEETLRLWVPSDNKYPMDQIIRNVKNDFPPRKSKLKVTMPDGSIEYTKTEFSVGELYMIRLDKWGGEFSAVAAGRFQAFGTIAKQHSSDKHRRPVRENPIKHIGESEVRHQQAYIGGDVCADAHDRSNNPAVADNVIMSILSAEVPSNIEHAVDRKKHPLGHNRVMEINRHVMRCDGIGFTTRRLQ